MNSNKLNKHFKSQFDSANCEFLPEDVRTSVNSDFELMSSVGIDNNKDQNRFFVIRNAVPEIIQKIFHSKLNDKTCDCIAAEVYRNSDKFPVDTLLGLIEAIDLALKKMIPQNLRPRIAYPQGGTINPLTQYDISRWVQATRAIYGLMVKGFSNEQAKERVVGNWETKEKMDYEHWLKFYKEGVPEKYPKLAGDGELFTSMLPVDILRARPGGHRFPNPIAGGEGNAQKRPPGMPQLPSEGDSDPVRDKIEDQRRKLVSRLNSAEKMLASMDGQLFAGDDQEIMLKLLQDLKRKIQIINKRTVKSSLFEDQIYRAANQLNITGRTKAAGFFYKLAQFSPGGGGGEPDMMAELGGGGGDVPGAGGGDDKKETHDLLQEFFDNITRGISDKEDTPEKREETKKEEEPTPAPAPAPAPAAPAPPPMPTAPAPKTSGFKLGTGLWKTAQVVPPAPVPPPAPAPAAPSVSIDPDPAEEAGVPDDNTDDIIDAALKNVTIDDVVSRLEMLVSVYNQREISRQLAILDIMMDRLGLASFFPALGEAMSKALEANQYIGNRLEEILGKVKGSVGVPDANKWIEPTPEKPNPQTAGIQQRLQQQEDEEEKRREMRKQKDLAKMQGGGQQQVPVGPETAAAAGPPVGQAPELQRPARVEKAPPIRTR